ncbi:hypothetical protein FS837_000332 [Tulasnella sp. UAMH 9824]|nr:hypothetical protein FS837_000332 [Tulasnella sp. UAMH 9824]
MGPHPKVHAGVGFGRRAFLIGPGGQATLAPPTNQPDLDDLPTTVDGEDSNLAPFIDPNEGQRPPTIPPQVPFDFHSVANEAPTQTASTATQGTPSVPLRPGMLGMTVATTASPAAVRTIIPITQVPPTAPRTSQAPAVESKAPSASLEVAVFSTGTSIDAQTTVSSLLQPSSSIPAAIGDPNDTNDSTFNIPIILGIVVASVVGIAVVAATISWILRMRRKEGFCGCLSGKKDEEDEIAKWDYNSSYVETTPDLFKEKPELVLDYDRTPVTSSLHSRSKEGNWSDMTAGTYHPATHPAALYNGGSLYGSFARSPTPAPIIMQPPYIPPPSIPIQLGLDGAYFTTTPRPNYYPPNDPFPNPHPPQVPIDIRTSPVQPTVSPGGTLVVANLAPGDISDGLSRPGTQSPWPHSPTAPPAVAIPQRPWTESFSPLLGHCQDRLKEDRVPLSPLPRETTHDVPGSEPVPWPPLNVPSKSKSGSSASSTHSQRSSVQSDLSSVAPRLPTPAVMSAAPTDASRSGWAATLKSNLFAALGAVGQMAVSSPGQGAAGGDAPAHPDAPIAERLTSVAPRSRTSSTRKRKSMQKASDVDLEEGLGSGRMVVVESRGTSSTRTSRANSTSGITESRPSRLYNNIKLSQRRHESKIKAINGTRTGKGLGGARAMQPTQSVSSIYSSSSGYTTDKGDFDEDILPYDILQMYAIGEMEEGDDAHLPAGKKPVVGT